MIMMDKDESHFAAVVGAGEASHQRITAQQGRLPHALLVHARRGWGRITGPLDLTTGPLCGTSRRAAVVAAASCRLFIAVNNHPDLPLGDSRRRMRSGCSRPDSRLCDVLRTQSYRGGRQGRRHRARRDLHERQRGNMPAEDARRATARGVADPDRGTVPSRLPVTIVSRCQAYCCGGADLAGRARSWRSQIRRSAIGTNCRIRRRSPAAGPWS